MVREITERMLHYQGQRLKVAKGMQPTSCVPNWQR